MRILFQALLGGIRLVCRSWGLLVLVLVLNLLLGLLLAVPLAQQLEDGLGSSEAAVRMRDGFDYPWWTAFNERQTGFLKTFSPDVLGLGFASKNLDLLLNGRLFGPLLLSPGASREDAGPSDDNRPLDPLLTGLGLLYLLIQTLLAGGILTTLAGAAGRWKTGNFAAACGRYFGRCLRLALVAGVAYILLFGANRWLAAWVDHQAREASDGRLAHAWLLGRYALLLLLVMIVHLTAGYARVRLVVKEQRSALAAFLCALRFCFRRPAITLGHYFCIVLLGVAGLGVYRLLDGSFGAHRIAGLLLMLVLAQGLVAARIGLRLALAGGQIEVTRRCGA